MNGLKWAIVEAARIIPDKPYLELVFRWRMRRKLNLEHPMLYNDKLQWLKLYDRRPLYTQMADKYAAKAYIKEHVGEKHVVATLGVWDSFDDIDLEALPDEFILKCTHDSGSYVICRDRETFDKDAARQKLTTALKRDFYLAAREWPYKNVPHRIIAEELLGGSTGLPRDLRFYCFDGEPRLMHIDFDRGTTAGVSVAYFDMDFKRLPIRHFRRPQYEGSIDPPARFSLLKELAREISHGIPHLRVDFYETCDNVYVGEMTFSQMRASVPLCRLSMRSRWEAGSRCRRLDASNRLYGQ